MEKSIRYPIGIQSFEKLRNRQALYVDKTGLIHKLINSFDYVFLSRPRRFGKSLLLSTIEAIFQGKKELFEGLAISDIESEWETHPVLRLDLAGESYENPDKLLGKVNSTLIEWSEKYDCRFSDKSISIRFKDIIRNAYEKTGHGVVVLIDEYDKPLLENTSDESLHEEIRTKLRGFYSVLKECDEYIRFAMLTGVSKFARLSIFSGLNNLTDISFYDEYNALCGISESEMHGYFGPSVKQFAEKRKITEEETWSLFKENYDGYHFSETGEDIYNPYSVLNAFAAGKIGQYWYSTGNPEFLVNLLKKEKFLLSEIEGAERSQEKLSDITVLHGDIVPLLFQAGYLTIKSWDNLKECYRLDFPNLEVRKAFWTTLADHYFHKTDSLSIFETTQFIKDFNEGKPIGFLTRLKSLFADTDSENEPDKEIHFQNMMAIVIKMLGLQVRTESHSAKGRSDMIVFTSSYIYIFEFKVDSTPEKALSQIHDREYAAPFEADPRKKFLIGVNFSTSTRNIDGWIIEET